MAALAMPAWRGLNTASMRKGSTNLLMATLEQARVAAVAQKTDTWFIFRHRPLPQSDDFCVVQKTADEKIISLATWQKLPLGMIFMINPEAAQNEPLPDEITTVLQKFFTFKSPAENEPLGYFQFNEAGAIIHPAAQEYQIFLNLGKRETRNHIASQAVPIAQIKISTLTGRAFIGGQ